MKRSTSFFIMFPVFLFFYAPLAVLVTFSFNDSKYLTSWKGFTWKWYTHLASDSRLIDAAINSLSIAFLAAIFATILGVLAALAIYRYRFTGRNLLRAMMYTIMVSPDIVMGVSLLMLFLLLGIAPGFVPLLLAHITFCVPVVATIVLARLYGFDTSLAEAAEDLGASELQVLRYVIFPLIWPAVLAGWILSFTLSMDDVIVSFFLTGSDYDILPLRIYSMVRLGVKPDVNALSSLMIGATIILVFISQFIMREKK
ncbi:MAG: spermidine/putrescine ABC transporter permease PotC [Desulfovibrio sp.]